jgi:hypothetical protein
MQTTLPHWDPGSKNIWAQNIKIDLTHFILQANVFPRGRIESSLKQVL